MPLSKDLSGKGVQIVTPVPDPTALTTDQLRREIAALRELIEGRLEGMDTATELVKLSNDKVPCLVKEAVRQLKEVTDEKFSSVQQQFRERDTRTEQTQKDSKVAVDAALQAAKEAVGEQNKSNALANAKMEAAFTKQVDAIGVQIQSNTKANDDKVDDLKSRLTTIESALNTRQVVTSDKNDKQGWLVPMIVSIGLGMLSIGTSLAVLLLK
jgi:hypothetical protein